MKLQPFEPYRWVMPILLHTNFLHLMMNLFSQLIIGSIIEPTLKMTSSAIIYFLSGYLCPSLCSIGGVLLSCLGSDAISVGASGAIYGWLGVLVF